MEGYNHEEPFDQGYIQVSDIHSVYYAQYGKKQNGKTGKPSYSCDANDCLLEINPVFRARAASRDQ